MIEVVEIKIDSVEGGGKQNLAHQATIDCPACEKTKLSLNIEESENWSSKLEAMRRAEALPNERHKLNERAKTGQITYDEYLIQRRRNENASSSTKLNVVSKDVGFEDVKCLKCKTVVRFNFQLIAQILSSNAPTMADLAKLRVHEEFQPEVRRILRLPANSDLSQFVSGEDLAKLADVLSQTTDAIRSNQSLLHLGRSPEEESLKRDILNKASDLKQLSKGLDSIVSARQSAYARAVEAAVIG